MKASTKRVGLDLTEGPIMKSLLLFAVPMILASLVQQLYSAVDLVIIGKYVGSVGTVAVSTGGELSDFMTHLAIGLASGGEIYISQLAGAKDEKNLKEAIGTLLTFLMGLSLLITIATLLFHNTLLDVLNCPEEAWDNAAQYMIITAVGMPLIFGYNGISSALRGMGESAQPLFFIVVAAVINIFADLLLVVVIPLGAAGTAIATVLSQMGAFLAAFFYMYRHREAFDFQLKLSYFRIVPKAMRRILRMAIPQLIRSFSVQGSMLWVKAQINSYGLIASSTYSIGNKIEKFMNVFVTSVDVAAGAMIGQNIGAKKRKRVNRILWDSLLCNLLFAVIVIGIFLRFPRQLFRLFTSDAEVIEFGVTFLRILSVGMLIVAFSCCFKSIVTGAGAALLSLIIGVMDGVCRIAICLLFFHVFKQGVQSYFWGAAFCMLVPGIISFLYFLSGKWKTKKLLSET